MLKELFELNNEYLELQKIVGNSLDCPGKGGNISVKTENKILVKASGADLKQPHKAVYMENLETEMEFFCSIENSDSKVQISTGFVKPTMEFGLHNIIKTKYVIHYHPVYVLPYLCSDVLDSSKFTVLEYANPGVDLTRSIMKAFEDKKLSSNFGTIMLKNHGVVIYANSIDVIKDLYNEIKDEFFEENLKCYTPDDIVDINNPELYLFRLAMEKISKAYSIKLNELSEETKDYLLNDADEQYRQQLMKGHK